MLEILRIQNFYLIGVITMNKPLCYAPFYAACIKGDKFKPCCVYEEYFDIKDDINFWNIPEIQDIRSKLLRGEFASGCSGCKMSYEQGLETDLDAYNQFIEENNIELDINIDTGNKLNFPIELDFRPSNLCNLKCRMCDFTNSSLLAKEINDNTSLQDFLGIKSKYKNTNGISSSSDWVFDLIKDKEYKKIKLLGGEPLIEDRVLTLLENIKGNPVVKITTNLISLPKRFKEILNNLNELHLRISIDAIGDDYEYIRTNAKWSKLEKNLSYVVSESKIKITGFNIVLMPYNIFSLTETLLYIHNFIKSNNLTHCSISLFPSTDKNIEVSAILPEDRDLLLSELKNIPELYQEYEIVKNIFNKNPFNTKDYKRFIEYNKIIDKIRGTNIVSIDERYVKYH